jgi:hypothetical protein
MIKKNAEDLLGASRGVGLDVNRVKTKYMVMSCHQNAVHNHNLLIEKFKYLGMTVKNQNFVHKEIRSDQIQGMLATILFRILCLSVCCLKTSRLKCKKLILPIVF